MGKSAVLKCRKEKKMGNIGIGFVPKCAFIAAVVAMAAGLTLNAGCSTKDRIRNELGGWLGPAVSDVQFSPNIEAAYKTGQEVRFSVNATATNTTPGELTFSWAVGDIGDIIQGENTKAVKVKITAVTGEYTGSITVKETLLDGSFKETTKNFILKVIANEAPAVEFEAEVEVAELDDGGKALLFIANVDNPDGDLLAVEWTVTGGEAVKTEFDGETANAWVKPDAGTNRIEILLAVSDGLGGDTEISRSYVHSPLDGAIEDSIWLVAPDEVVAGEPFEVGVYAWFSTTKPVNSVNTIRVTANESELQVAGVDFGEFWVDNDFDIESAFPMLFEQTATFFDIGMFPFNGVPAIGGVAGKIAKVEMIAPTAGTYEMSIVLALGEDIRTAYIDGAGNTFTFDLNGRANMLGDWQTEATIKVT